MSEKQCQPEKLEVLINGPGGSYGGGLLEDEIKSKLAELIDEIDITEINRAEGFIKAFSQAIAVKVSEAVTQYLNTLTPRLTTPPTPPGTKWTIPTFESKAAPMFSDEPQ